MKYFSALFLSIFLASVSVLAQNKMDKYVVAKGETVNQIAQKFKITPLDIYKLNPDAQNGLKPNSVLLIPKTSEKRNEVAQTKTKEQVKIHEVVAKETLFGIENKYDITDEDLKKANPFLEKEGLQIGQILNIPSKNNSKTTVVTKNVVVYHTVVPKETKYSIAKQYDITVEELEKKNPEIVSNLPVGYPLIIKGNRPKPVTKVVTSEQKSTTKVVVEEPKAVVSKPATTKVSKEIVYIDYQVKAKETFYSLSKMFGLTQQQLIELNPALSGGVVEGMMLKVPSKSNQIAANSVKQKVVLSQKNSTDKKTLVLLLPFNITKNEADTINSTAMRLKNDKFLNMTLDFYSGALVAIDSAKQIGISMDVKIFDSNETKTTSNVASIFKENNLENADAVVGPFYQSNVEKTANLFAQNNVPVISPLSKDSGNPFDNLYQTIVSATSLKTAMFDFLKSKGGNVIAVVDKKKETIKKYIQENQKEIQFAPLTETGGLNVDGFKKLLVKDKMNYVILETANTGMIKYTMNAMMGVMVTYQVQLVILEPNETLDTDEISFENLTKLHLMYPSAVRENTSPEAQIFFQNYRKKNKVKPSTFAVRGFDITFDTMMRLSQDKTYQETAETMITEQVENKFEYYKKEDGGYANKGVYILYYDTDLMIKEAK